MADAQIDDPMLSVESLPTLPGKGGRLPDSGEILAYLTEQGIEVKGDTVNVKSDGTIEVDTADVKALEAAWQSYVPPTPPPTAQETALSDLDAVTDLAGMKVWMAENVVPRLGM